MKKRLYVSGGISGIKDLNQPLFDSVTAILRRRGYDVVNPHELAHNLVDVDLKPSYSAMMKCDLLELLMCSAIVLLPNWQLSRGSMSELNVAVIAGLQVLVWRDSCQRMYRMTEAAA